MPRQVPHPARVPTGRAVAAVVSAAAAATLASLKPPTINRNLNLLRVSHTTHGPNGQ